MWQAWEDEGEGPEAEEGLTDIDLDVAEAEADVLDHLNSGMNPLGEQDQVRTIFTEPGIKR